MEAKELRVFFRLRSENFYQRHHWSYRRRAIKKLAEVVKEAAKDAGVMPAWGKRRVSVMFVFPDARSRDKDNFAGKVLWDALVRAGLLVDDSPECLEVGEVSFEKGKDFEIRLRIEDL